MRRATLPILRQVDFLAVNAHPSWCLDCQKGSISRYSHDANDDLIPDDNRLADLPQED
jgi:hypothetical protein